jgi:competence protein ComEC
MAVVAGIVFFTIRALLALVPALTVSFPIRTYFIHTLLSNAISSHMLNR